MNDAKVQFLIKQIMVPPLFIQRFFTIVNRNIGLINILFSIVLGSRFSYLNHQM